MFVEYLITIKNLEGIDKNAKYFFVKFQAPFSQEIFNIHLYISYISFHTFNSLTLPDRQTIYTLIISLLIEKPFCLLRPQSFSFQIVSEFIDILVKFSNFMSQGWSF